MAIIGGAFLFGMLVIGGGVIGYNKFRENFPIVLFDLIGVFVTMHILLTNPTIISEPLKAGLNRYNLIFLVKMWGIIIVFSLIYKIALYVIRNSNED